MTRRRAEIPRRRVIPPVHRSAAGGSVASNAERVQNRRRKKDISPHRYSGTKLKYSFFNIIKLK